MSIRRFVRLFVVAAFFAAAVSSPCASIWNGHALTVLEDGDLAVVTPLSDDVVRVRMIRGTNFGRDHSYAVINQNLGLIHASEHEDGAASILTTANLIVTIQHHPFRIRFATHDGETLDADDERGTRFDGASFQLSKELPSAEHIYGLGEKSGKLDKRGWLLGGYNYVMWNTDTYAWDSSADPLYVSVPFYIGVLHGHAHGIFLDNTWRSHFDVGHDRPDSLTLGAEGGEVNYYFINGPQPRQVIERYTALTGRMSEPPLWSLGYQQCRYSYYPEARVRQLAETFRQKRVPADAIWLDIHYMDNYKPFTWNHDRFPDPKKMIDDLAAEGFRLVTIVDPHPKQEVGYAPYDSGVAGGYFIKKPDGSLFTGNVWPSQAEKNPAPSVFPDFSMPAARVWWGGLFKGLVDAGVAGIWNDMDEPSVFVPLTGTMASDAVQDNEGQPATHLQLHNVFGQQMTRATFEGLAALRPNERPFVLTRSSFAGGQRYAAVWTGDNTADWGSLRQSISTCLGLGVSGFGFVGTDVGGFVHTASAELFTRWLQVAVFYPFMRTHTDLPNPDKEPWSFGEQSEAVNKRAIELRYELLPYIANAMYETARTGVPAMRPLFVDYPDDEAVAALDDEFLFGSDLLVAPVVWEGVASRTIYLPRGQWFDYWTGKAIAGGQTISVPTTIETLPVFVRGGAFIFRQPVVQSTREMAGNPLRVLIAPAPESEAELYEDDGATLNYEHGEYLQRRFHQVQNDQGIAVDIAVAGGEFRPAARALELNIWSEREPRTVSLAVGGGGARDLPRLDASALAGAGEGWTWADHAVAIKTRDRFERLQFAVAN
ncbi:MAG TPA: glycoside hydrolase family 31 protein [Verrucomicrobiae bacterium]|jgi:alpha-glucosidase|nr:glycoside hydrolase family 31 protein [Verrucomicrobiae bacterium]